MNERKKRLTEIVRKACVKKAVYMSDGEPIESWLETCVDEEVVDYLVDYLIKCGVTVQNEWIPVSEPPKENGIYCVMVENHKSRKYKMRTHARYKNGRWLDLYDDWENRCWHVTHWFPLPEVPKMKGGEEE